MFYRGKHARKGKASIFAKVLAIVLSAALLTTCVVGGSLAWLMDQTQTVKNTFTYGDINITLTETDTGDGDNDPNTNFYAMIPGNSIAKDPKVTVKAGSEESWLFVKLEHYLGEELNGTVSVADQAYGFGDYLSYEIAEGWTALDETNYPGVYYREAVKSAEDSEPISVLKGDRITVKGTVTKAMLNALDTDAEGNLIDPAKYPMLAVTAYAVQRDANVATAADAWAIVSQK